MPDEYIVEQCSPTLAGMKAGNLFPVKKGGSGDVHAEARRLNAVLREKGLRAVPIARSAGCPLIYLYRPDLLARALERPEARCILEEKGYCCGNTSCCLAQLMKKLAGDADFPHEVGLFLGYPPADVRGFMENPCGGYKCTGCWKVYEDPEAAEKLFRKYKRCTEVLRRKLSQGRSLSQLAAPAGPAA